MGTASRPNRARVFINLPFDSAHERLYLALIAGLSALGFTPRKVADEPGPVVLHLPPGRRVQ